VLGPRPEIREGGADQYETARVGAGEPAWGVDVDESTIPHESGLVPVSVDFDKGCFLGQELVARIDSRGGNVPRHLRRLESLDGGAMTVGTDLRHEGKSVGSVSSAAGRLALAMVHRSVQAEDIVEVDGMRAVVKALPGEAAPVSDGG
jgi:folate-binding protein YgfZ